MAAKQILTWAALVIGITAMPALAQNAGGPQGGQDIGPGGGGPGGGGPGGFGGGPGGGGPGGFGGGGPGGFGGPGGGGPGGPGGNFDPAQFMQMRLQNIQQQLNASDEEFQAIAPKIQKILTLQQQTRGGRGRGGPGGPGGPGGFGGPGGAGGPQANGQPLSEVQQARQALQAAVDDQNSTPALLKTKMDAYRAASAKASTDLAEAQKDLQSVLTQRQEASLLLSNILN